MGTIAEAIARLPASAPAQPRQNDFFTAPPSLIKVPLVGTEIIRFELAPESIKNFGNCKTSAT